MRRIVSSVLVAGVMASMAFVAPVAVARPATQSTTCDLKGSVKINPGLTFSVQAERIKLSGTLSGCSGGGVTGGTGAGKGKGNLSCTSGTATATIDITWNTTETSTVKMTVDVSNGSVSGTVSSGKFAGESVSGSLTVQPTSGNCFTPVTKAKISGSVSL